MADYYPLLERAVSSLPESTPETRRAIYDRARKALLGQLRNVQPPVAEADIDRENVALDEAIAKLEEALAARAAPAAEAPAPAAEKPFDKPVEPTRAADPGVSRPVPQRPAAPGPLRPPPPRMPIGKPFSRPTPPPGPPRAFGAAPGPLAAASPAPTPFENTAPPPPPAADTKPPVDEIGPPAPAMPGAERAAETDEKIGGILKRFGRPRVDDEVGETEFPLPEPKPASEENGFADAERREAIRPVAPSPAPQTQSFRRMGILAAVLVVVVAGVAALAFKLRDNPEDFARAKNPAPAQDADAGSGKIVDRVSGGQSARAPTQPSTPQQQQQQQPRVQPNASAVTEPAISVAQRAAILVEAPDDPQKVKTLIGSVVWRVDTSGDPSPALVADLDLRDAKLKAVMRITRNTDPKLPASHTIEIRFTPTEDSEVPGVKAIDTPQMRIEDRPSGESLAGVPAAILPNFFLVGLTNSENMTARNLDLMKSRAWFDVPMLLTNGKIAKLTFEKGTSGDRALNQVLQAWQQQ